MHCSNVRDLSWTTSESPADRSGSSASRQGARRARPRSSRRDHQTRTEQQTILRCSLIDMGSRDHIPRYTRCGGSRKDRRLGSGPRRHQNHLRGRAGPLFYGETPCPKNSRTRRSRLSFPPADTTISARGLGAKGLALTTKMRSRFRPAGTPTRSAATRFWVRSEINCRPGRGVPVGRGDGAAGHHDTAVNGRAESPARVASARVRVLLESRAIATSRASC